MAGYRRFIAYVYDYESGKKGSNCGFIKVEVKDQQCSVEIHLHCPGLPENVKCNIYGFTRKDGLINGILLDTCETEKETVECLIITDATDMNDSGVAMGKLGGMIITSDTGGFFGTEWDDQPIRPENFHEIKAMPAADIPDIAPYIPLFFLLLLRGVHGLGYPCIDFLDLQRRLFQRCMAVLHQGGGFRIQLDGICQRGVLLLHLCKDRVQPIHSFFKAFGCSH